MRQQRNNIPASSDKEYFKRAIFLPFLDAMIQQLNIRFGEQTISVVRALSLIPRHIDQTQDDTSSIKRALERSYGGPIA